MRHRRAGQQQGGMSVTGLVRDRQGEAELGLPLRNLVEGFVVSRHRCGDRIKRVGDR